MPQLFFAALTAGLLVLAPRVSLAAYDAQAIEDECRQIALEEGIPVEEVAAFVAECVAQATLEDSGRGSEAGNE